MKGKKPLATRTVFTSIANSDDLRTKITFVSEPYDVRIVIDKGKTRMKLGIPIREYPKGKEYLVDVMATDDPTPCYAGGAVSLGYGRLNILMRKAKKIDNRTFEGDVEVRFMSSIR